MNGLSDVNTSGAITGSVLKYNGSSWVAGTDNTSSNSNGLVFNVDLNGTTLDFYEGSTQNSLITSVDLNSLASGGSSVSSLSDLSNVSSASPSTGQVLKWNGSLWAPANDETSSGSSGDNSQLSLDLAYVGQTISLKEGNTTIDYIDASDLFNSNLGFNLSGTTLSLTGYNDQTIDSIDLSSLSGGGSSVSNSVTGTLSVSGGISCGGSITAAGSVDFGGGDGSIGFVNGMI